MKKIDIHVHTRAFKGIPRKDAGTTYATPEELIAMYDKLGVEKGVIMTSFCLECGLQGQSNEETMYLVEKYPGKFDWFCNIDPRMGDNTPNYDLSYFISYYKERGAKGVGEVSYNLYMDDPFMENLYYHCEKNSMSIIIHIAPKIGGCYGLVDELGLPRLEKILAKYPGLTILGHSHAFWSEISADNNEKIRNTYPTGKVIPGGRVVELMRKYPNLHGDLSAGSGYNAVSRDEDFGCAFIEEFQDKLYFGTDICAPNNKPQLSFWLDRMMNEGRISKEAYKKVSRENALWILAGAK